MRRKTLLNRNVIIVLMLFIFLMTAFVSTAYSLWYFPNSGNPKEVNADMKVDDIEENFKKDTSNYLKIIDCRDGKIPDYDDFAKSESGFLDNSKNFTKDGTIFKGKNGNYSKKVFGVSSLKLESLVSSVSYRPGTSITSLGTSATGSGTSVTDKTEIYLYDLLNSQYKLVDHLTNESIELKDGKGTSSDESYSSTKFEDYRKNIGRSFFKSRILFLVPRDTKWINNKQPETLPKVDSDYNIYFHNEATGGDDPSKKDPNKDYSNLDHVWLWNDRTDFGVSLPLVGCSKKKDDTNYNKSVHINYETLYQVCNDLCDTTKQSGFIMTPQTAPTGIVFKTEKGTDFAPKDDKNGKIEYLALPLPPNNSKFDIYINAAKDGKFTIRTDQDVDLTKNKNIVYYSANGLDHLWMWSKKEEEVKPDFGCWISSNYVYKFKMTRCNKDVSCFSYNYGEKFNFYTKWTGSIVGTSADFSHGFTFDKNETGEKINYDYDSLILTNYKGEIQADADGKDGRDNISGLFNGTSECNGDCTSIYLLENNKHVDVYTSKDDFIKELNKLN
mgnify:CR=1 FL=1